MKFIYKTYFLLILISLSGLAVLAQDNNLHVTLNKSFFTPGDTLKISARQSAKKLPTATLFLLAENETGMTWEMRWPMLNGRSEISLIIPDSIPAGYYRFNFSVMQNLFTVFGKVKKPENANELQATLLTAEGDLYETDVTVDNKGSFTYKNVLFLKDAMLVFTLPEDDRKDFLDIEISTILDSISFPRAGKTVQVFLGDHERESPPPALANNNDSIFPSARTLEAVTVYTKPENRGEIFNKNYSRGLFKDMNERVINLLDDPALSNSMSPLQLVASRTAGFNYNWGIYPRAVWRGQMVQFYVDEFRTDILQVEATPVSDIAIIKTYTPPFIGNPGGSGGAVAIYTKRGGFSGDNYQNAFRVSGYSPLIAEFPAEPGKY